MLLARAHFMHASILPLPPTPHHFGGAGIMCVHDKLLSSYNSSTSVMSASPSCIARLLSSPQFLWTHTRVSFGGGRGEDAPLQTFFPPPPWKLYY